MNTVIKTKMEASKSGEVIEKLIRGRNQLFGDAAGWGWITQSMTDAVSVILGLEQKMAEIEYQWRIEKEENEAYNKLFEPPSTYKEEDLEELKRRIADFNDWFDKKYGYGKYEKESEQE